MPARLLLVLMIFAGVAGPAAAHEIRPAYLEIREIEPASYDILWKTPARGDMRLALNVVLPATCAQAAPARATRVDGAVVERWRSICDGGLPGRRITIENLETSLTDVIVRFEPLSGASTTLRLDGAAPTAVIPERQSLPAVVEAYFTLGVEHILLGFDHLLFVLCLLLLVGRLGRLLGAVTAFTAAHSITLGATTMGWLRLASAPVEACIALSIACLAAEVIRARNGEAGLTQRWPWIASLGFGLLHGFGFASALHEVGLPDRAVPLALLSFNLGVEAGQIAFIAAVLAAAWTLRRFVGFPAWSWRLAPYAAGTVGAYWFAERLSSFIR